MRSRSRTIPFHLLPLSLRIVPSFLLAVSSVLSMVRIPVPILDVATPFFPVMILYFFTLWQPRSLPYGSVFVAAIIYDAFQMSLFGSYALILMIMRALLGTVRARLGYRDSTLYHSLIFIGVGCTFFILEWLWLALQPSTNVIVSTLLVRNLISIALYPLLHMILSSIVIALQTRS
ncbi:MAG: hypothetical protein EAZ74_05335 [Alphaproteobacteria bacterium]|nr:MAG: hypothetical protein EAY76_06835 [Alphaproteobacteria bacterium]TAF13592.1 MAG: hypothetical protein EAZ74_05335 [Alphaproteobacteria bacterium]TAF39174.1 MAG: hypothetical protein EAZ66_05275 [Alphaproteobacteria bacterium]TAF74967.1 MAG: hypothetical protein EAZ52_07910 [Alphaproteobacteria bacterium]